MNKKLILSSFLLLLLFSCKNNTNRYFTNEENKDIKISFHRFEQELDAIDSSNIDTQKQLLNDKYPEYFHIYNSGLMRLGEYDSPDYNDKLLHYLNDTIYRMVYDTVECYYSDISVEEQKLTEAFRKYNQLFPKQQIPCCYTHVSGFNAPIVVGDSILAISLENYLGYDHDFYKRLGYYTYLLPNKNRECLVNEAMRGWLVSEFPQDVSKATLLSSIIQEGKIIFLHQLLMPQEEPYLILGLTPEQYQWCEKNEMNVWGFTIENEYLFSSKRSVIVKYLKPAPFFNFFGIGSSPLVGRYIGWHIVSSYMERNKDVTVDELMKNTNAQHILEASGYKPKQ